MNDRSLASRPLICTIFLAMLTLSLLTSCRSQKGQANIVASPIAPADFQLRFHVKNPSAEPIANPLLQTSQTILQNDRSLRVAIGPGATADYYPGVTRRLEPAEVDQLWQWLQKENLLSSSSVSDRGKSDGSEREKWGKEEGKAQVTYDLQILLGNRTIHHTAIAGTNPAMDRLAKLLLLWRSGPIWPSLESGQPAEAK